MVRLVSIAALAALLLGANPAIGQDQEELAITTDKVVAVTRFLEANPLDPVAPALRSLMIDWEDKATEVVDYVCPGVLVPIPSDAAPHSPELLVQFIFGSAAYQLEHPEDKGALIPSQIAAMRSMLKAYGAFLAADPNARIARLDELVLIEAQGRLPEHLTPIVQKECNGGS